MSKVQQQAQEFVNACKKYGFSVEVTDTRVKISKAFTPGDKAAFTEADMDAPSVLALAPLKGGSIWGTDGGSVGGYVGLGKGEFYMYKTGTGSRFTTAVRKALINA